MPSLREKFYFLAPTTDSPAEGPIFLGAIITHPKNADTPLNNAPLPIDPALMPMHTTEDHTQSITINKERAISSNSWASFLRMIFGIGGDVEGEMNDRDSEEWSIEMLKTMSFNPDPNYIQQSLNNSAVKEFIAKDANWLGRSHMYMITGLKLAYGASSIIDYSKSKGLNLSAGIDATNAAIPAEGGSKIGESHTEQVHLSTGKKSPFALAFRMQKIIVSSSGNITNKPVSGGMLGMPEKRAAAEDSSFIVQGLEERDANAKDCGIKESWEIEENGEICGCALSRDSED